MQYLGGKSRIAKQISEIINKNLKEDSRFVSLFCGACSIESKISSNNKLLNDSHYYLIELFSAIQKGWEIPSVVTKEMYDYTKQNMNENPPLTGFIGFACGFGGKWFGGYAKNNSGTNYALQSKNSLLKKINGLMSAIFINDDYKNIQLQNNDVVYCDPPYFNTTNYSNSNIFNHVDFWEYMRKISSITEIVFISEINAPKDFVSIWEKPLKRNLDKNKNNLFDSMEKLFIHESQLGSFIS